jgi:NAD(P)-dependent dehydrogenase (short-subunit alcohol dehydrogenase family)
MELTGKVAIVAGGAGNIGTACSLRLAEAGAAVLVFDIPKAPVQQRVDEITAAGGRAVGYQGDISKEADVIEMTSLCLREFGRIDTLVNVAANLELVAKDRDLTTMEASYWDEVMAVNLRGPMLTCKHALPAMLAQGAGSIVNFTSSAAFAGDMGLTAYASSKAAQLGLTTSIATAYGRRGIRCNVISPSGVWNEERNARAGAERLKQFADCTLTPRLGVPDDVGHLVVYLASDKSSYITGQTLHVDGGGRAHQPWVRPGSSSAATGNF